MHERSKWLSTLYVMSFVFVVGIVVISVVFGGNKNPFTQCETKMTFTSREGGYMTVCFTNHANPRVMTYELP